MANETPPPPSKEPTNPPATAPALNSNPDPNSALALSRLPPPFSHSLPHSNSVPPSSPTDTPASASTSIITTNRTPPPPPIAPTPTPTSTSTPPAPPAPPPPTFIAQGAEGLVFKTHFLTPATPCMLKYRPPKAYRHPTLDRRLTRGRILAEARVLVKGRREGLDVPVLFGLDADAGWILTEWIPGPTIRNFLESQAHQTLDSTSTSTSTSESQAHQTLDSTSTSTSTSTSASNSKSSFTSASSPIHDLMHRIGQTVGRMHAAGIVHGDLTTSNIMLRGGEQPGQQHDQQRDQHLEQTTSSSSTAAFQASSASSASSSSIVLIDFGLASQTTQEEDRAVDLYVLERAFGATHPHAETLFGVVLEAYGREYKGGPVVLRRLADVRARGRKKSMVG